MSSPCRPREEGGSLLLARKGKGCMRQSRCQCLTPEELKSEEGQALVRCLD